jgi:phage gp29-like protein
VTKSPAALSDHLGRPIERALLKRELAAPETVSGVRQIISGHPASGITPQRLAALLRAAEHGDPTGYLELAEDMEERDLHYQGVLGTRKLAVIQRHITVEAASDDAAGQAHADLIREWLAREEITAELFDMLDAIGKGFSVTEIMWDTAARSQAMPGRVLWLPARLEWRDPRWFDFANDGRTVLLRTAPADGLPPAPMALSSYGSGRAELPAGKFIVHAHKAKSGLPIRGGLARAACWAWMFKSFSLKDWVVFAEAYGQPLRVGKYGPGASPAEKDALLAAVANIASDCAAIIPDSMLVEFVSAPTSGGGSSGSTTLYKDLCDWLDQQVSKAVLGQTTTTDAISGGHAVAREHRLVQEDIERADARLLAGTLNRQLVPLIIAFNFGQVAALPRISIGRAEPVDITAESEALAKLVPLGLEVEMSVVRDRLGYPDPAPDARLLGGHKMRGRAA